MKPFNKYLSEILYLSTPILLGNIGQMLINIGDVFVAGRYSTNTLAAISVASAIFMTFIIGGFGLTSAITPVLANYRGQKKQTKKYFLSTIIYSFLISFILFIFVNLAVPFIYKIGLNPEIIKDTVNYIKISAYSIFGMILFASLKEFLQSYEIVKLPNILLLSSVIFNVGLNFLLVYGFWIIPSFGTTGLAISSLIVRTALAIILFLYCIKINGKTDAKEAALYIKELIKVGFPISCAIFTEFLGFNIIAVLVGRFAPIYAACHNIIITIASAVFMLPFSIASALSVKIGIANGSKNTKDIKNYILSSLIFVIIYSFVISALYLLFKEKIMEIFTSDKEVISLGSSIMLLAACFTVFDSIQTVCCGALRGLKRTFEIMIANFIAYILISIPLGLLFAYKFNLALEGFWLGLTFGLFGFSVFSGSFLIKRYFKLKKKYQIT